MTANPSLERTSGAWARCGGLSMRVCAPGQARPLTSNVEPQPQALARLVGWTVTRKDLALRMRCL
jgi:hypothetical protein